MLPVTGLINETPSDTLDFDISVFVEKDFVEPEDTFFATTTGFSTTFSFSLYNPATASSSVAKFCKFVSYFSKI